MKMNRMINIVNKMKQDWTVAKKPVLNDELGPFPLACIFAENGVSRRILDKFILPLPNDVHEFWSIAEHAYLFKDMLYGQWGIEILSPEKALMTTQEEMQYRPKEYLGTDLVLGHFIGDSDLLIVRCDPDEEDYGSIVIGLPIDHRKNWHFPAKSFLEYLTRLLETQGEKYWARRK